MTPERIPVPLHAELDAHFGQYVTAGFAPGLVYGLTETSGLTHTRGFGVVGADGAVPTADTPFPIASMTKSFVACAALIARDLGLLSLEDPITRFVPEFAASSSGAPVRQMPTVGMLLSMCGGLTEDNAWVDPFVELPTVDLLATVTRGVKFSRPPGTAFEYSNLGFTLAALATSRASGRSLGELLREGIFEPLGLTSTFLDSEVPAGLAVAVGHRLDAGGEWTPLAVKASDAFAGSGGIVSTVGDLARWVTWLGSGFRAHDGGDEVLSAVSRRELQRIHVASPAAVVAPGSGHIGLSMTGYALGLRVDQDVHYGSFVAHAGGLPGFRSYMRWHPVSGRGVIVLTNSHRGSPVTLATTALASMLAREHAPAQSVSLWQDTRRLRAEADRLIRCWDHDLAAKIFADNVDFDEPLTDRRDAIAELIAEIGPLLSATDDLATISAATPAEVTWAIPATHGELIAMIHLTPVDPPQIQEFVVTAHHHNRPRAARPVDVSAARADLGDAWIGPLANQVISDPTDGIDGTRHRPGALPE